MSQLKKLHIDINGTHSLVYGPKLLSGRHKSSCIGDPSRFDTNADESPNMSFE